jgi:hypothetical protein
VGALWFAHLPRAPGGWDDGDYADLGVGVNARGDRWWCLLFWGDGWLGWIRSAKGRLRVRVLMRDGDLDL